MYVSIVCEFLFVIVSICNWFFLFICIFLGILWVRIGGDIIDSLVDKGKGQAPSGHDNAVDIASPNIPPTVEDDYIAPFIGMKFQTTDDAKKYYQEFGATQGFNVRTRTSQCNGTESGKPTCVKYVCSCEGKYKGKKVVSDVGTSKRRRTSHDRHNCLATNIKMCDDGTWAVSKFSNEQGGGNRRHCRANFGN